MKVASICQLCIAFDVNVYFSYRCLQHLTTVICILRWAVTRLTLAAAHMMNTMGMSQRLPHHSLLLSVVSLQSTCSQL